MEEQLLARKEFYCQTTTTYVSKETKTINFRDSVDACMANGYSNGQSKCIALENSTAITNGSSRSEATYSNGIENKSFIQQRVERLYGPGALAQGFFISKRQKNRFSESEEKSTQSDDRHSKSLTENYASGSVSTLKLSASSPTLPVLRHLRPEFRAQLPILSPKKGPGDTIPKSSTMPAFKEENGHAKEMAVEEGKLVNGNHNVIAESDENLDDSRKDGHYFLRILDQETKRLLELASKIEQELENEDLSEEVKGKLRSASGKARLLASQKMQQFRGLCTNNINQVVGAQYPTTNQDLQGFWDMVLLQVDQIDQLFKEIDELKQNNWQEVSSTMMPSNRTNLKPRKVPLHVAQLAANSTKEEARKERQAKRRQMLEERRRAMKENAAAKQGESIEIYVPESS